MFYKESLNENLFEAASCTLTSFCRPNIQNTRTTCLHIHACQQYLENYKFGCEERYKEIFSRKDILLKQLYIHNNSGYENKYSDKLRCIFECATTYIQELLVFGINTTNEQIFIIETFFQFNGLDIIKKHLIYSFHHFQNNLLLIDFKCMMMASLFRNITKHKFSELVFDQKSINKDSKFNNIMIEYGKLLNIAFKIDSKTNMEFLSSTLYFAKEFLILLVNYIITYGDFNINSNNNISDYKRLLNSILLQSGI